MRIGRWAAAAAAALLLSGCAMEVRGTAQPRAQSNAVLGDLTTLDFCSLAGLDTLRARGFKPSEPKYSFDYCTVPIEVQEEVVKLRVGTLLAPGSDAGIREPTPGETLPPGLGDERSKKPDNSLCTRYLTFSDGTLLPFKATNDYAASGRIKGPQPLCDAAKAALDGAVAAVVGGKVAHVELPAASPGRAEACGLVADAAVTQQLGTKATRRSSLTKHSCIWETGDPNRYLLAVFMVTERDPGYSVVQVAGRSTSVHELEGAADCELLTTFGPPPKPRGRELMTIQLALSGAPSPDACARVTALAQDAWPKLPPG